MWWLALAPAGFIGSAALAAQASPSSGTDLAQWGVLGIAVAALSAFARQAYNRERDRADRLETELAASRARELSMAEKMGTEVTTTVLAATQAMAELNTSMADLARRRRRDP